jgi:exonuclease SbcC
VPAIPTDTASFQNQGGLEQSVQRALEGLKQAAQGAETSLHEAEARLTAGQALHAGLTAERQAVLGGRPAQDVEDDLEGAVRAAEAGQAAGEEAARLASEERVARETRARELQETALRLAERLTAAQALRDTRLQAAGLTLEAVTARLARPDAWLLAEAAALDTLREEVTKTRSALATCEERTSRHREAGVPSRQAAATAEALGQAEHVRQAAVDSLGQARYQLDEDLRARQTQQDELAVLDGLRADALVWERLRDLIGSADGKKFRTYAQSLTLDALLELANLHLRELRPRYRLERVRGDEALELQVVDRDMAHEVRSTQSLSGGETFLVSLALALALSSFASNKRLIRSLFIDEGFGSLDPQTLEDAIATLDALQATGRQVGLISHVPGLGERLGIQVRVTPVGGGRSEMRILTT